MHRAFALLTVLVAVLLLGGSKPVVSYFSQKAKAQSEHRLFVVLFGSETCVNCVPAKPHAQSIARYGRYYYVDVDKEPKAAMAVGVRVLPTLVLFQFSSPPVSCRFVGLQGIKDFAKLMEDSRKER